MCLLNRSLHVRCTRLCPKLLPATEVAAVANSLCVCTSVLRLLDLPEHWFATFCMNSCSAHKVYHMRLLLQADYD
jgi:hypothetical protein